LQQSQARSLTKKLVVSTTSNVTALPTISETYEFTNTDYRTATDTTNAPQQSWSAYVSASLSTNIDSDHFTTIDAFYDVNDALSLGITDSTHTANVNYEYNFLIENFENAISSPAYSERILPNMYVIMYAKMAKDVGSQKAVFDDLITLSGTINATQIYPLQNKVFTNLNPSGEYHDLFAQKLIDIQNGIVSVDTTALQAVMANIVIPPEQLSAINDLSAMKEMYPMYNEINLTMDKFSFVCMHYPIASWDGMNANMIHLHGHTHLPKHLRIADGRAMDVGIDGNDLEPISLDQIISLLKDQPIKKLCLPKDHHEKRLI
jgi:hypothetical protein